MAAGLGANVSLLDINLNRLRYLNEILPANVTPLFSSEETITNLLKEVDLVIGAVLISGAKAPKIIRKEMLAKMSPGTVLVDVAVDQGGCFETCEPTTHEAPTFTVDGIIHYCVTNMPGAVPLTATEALNQATLSYIHELADKGIDQALAQNAHLANGLNIQNGKAIHPAIREAMGLDS